MSRIMFLNHTKMLSPTMRRYKPNTYYLISEFQVNGLAKPEYDAFLLKLTSSGDTLLWRKFISGSKNDFGCDVYVDPLGNVYVAGYTMSDDFTGSYQTASAGSQDAFVAKYSSQGSMIYFTYLGGSSEDYARGVVGDGSGNAYVVGETNSSDFPSRNALSGYGGGWDGFLTKLDPSGTAIFYSTFLAGTGSDYASHIALDSSNMVYVTGTTDSSGFLTTDGALQRDLKGSCDIFVMKLFEWTNVLPGGFIEVVPFPLYSTLLGGSDFDSGPAIAVGTDGSAYLTGTTMSEDFPVTEDAFQMRRTGCDSAFVSRINTAGNGLLYSTYLSGKTRDLAQRTFGGDIALDTSGNAYVVGSTLFNTFPTRLPVQSDPQGGCDIFLSKLSFESVQAVQLKGLLAFYPLDGNAEDVSGNGKHGTFLGAGTPVAKPGTDYSCVACSYEGEAYYFNQDVYLRVPLDINPSRYPRLTMGAWAKPYSSSGTVRQVISHDNGGYDRSLAIDHRGGGLGWSAFCGSGGVLGYEPIDTDKWTFLAVVYDQETATVTLHVDDKTFSKTGTLGTGHDYTYIGANPTFGEYFDGFIDNVFFFDHALSTEDLTYIRKMGEMGLRRAIPSKGYLPAIYLLLQDGS
jgi:hypothetical protein